MPTTSDAVPLIGTHTRYLFNKFTKKKKLKKNKKKGLHQKMCCVLLLFLVDISFTTVVQWKKQQQNTKLTKYSRQQNTNYLDLKFKHSHSSDTHRHKRIQVHWINRMENENMSHTYLNSVRMFANTRYSNFWTLTVCHNNISVSASYIILFSSCRNFWTDLCNDSSNVKT